MAPVAAPGLWSPRPPSRPWVGAAATSRVDQAEHDRGVREGAGCRVARPPGPRAAAPPPPGPRPGPAARPAYFRRSQAACSPWKPASGNRVTSRSSVYPSGRRSGPCWASRRLRSASPIAGTSGGRRSRGRASGRAARRPPRGLDRLEVAARRAGRPARRARRPGPSRDRSTPKIWRLPPASQRPPAFRLSRWVSTGVAPTHQVRGTAGRGAPSCHSSAQPHRGRRQAAIGALPPGR